MDSPATIAVGRRLNLRQVAGMFRCRASGKRLSINAVRRWALKGVAGERLATVSIGGLLYTSVEELARWRRAVAAARIAARICGPMPIDQVNQTNHLSRRRRRPTNERNGAE
jgi:hypothetical protein